MNKLHIEWNGKLQKWTLTQEGSIYGEFDNYIDAEDAWIKIVKF